MKRAVALFLTVFLLVLSLCSCTDRNQKTYTVNFNSNGGTAVATQEIGTLTEAPQTTREAYAFCGWYLDQEFKMPVTYPMQVEKDMTLYAKWTKDTDQLCLANAAVKFDVENEYNYKAEYNIIPPQMDIQALANQGYSIQIDVTYEVYYVKDYNVALDLGYMGAPDHDVLIVDPYDDGEIRENIPTTKEPQTNCVSTVISAADLLNRSFYLKLLTYNMQNVVYFQNIVINYICLG